jgi:hypothetical protein
MMRYRLLVALLFAVLAFPTTLAAQTASPDASPAAATCSAPELPPGTPTPMEDVSGASTPSPPSHDMTASPEAADEAEAVAEVAEAATPAAQADTVAAGTPADEATSARVVAAVENLIACLGTGNALGFAALVTPNYLMTEFGTSNPYDIPLFLEGFPPIALRSATDVQVHDDGRLSADVTTLVGGYQVDRFRAVFVRQGDLLLLDEEPTLPVEGADVTVDVTLLDFSFELSQDTLPADALISFTLTNAGAYPHEFAVVRLPEGVTVEQVLEDPALEEQVQFIGGAFAEPGGTGDFALEGLEPGTYTAVCFVDEPDGVPHIVRGMVAEFVVE